MTLFQKAAKGIKWSFIDNITNLVIQFVVGIILARLLFPEDFGIIGMAYVFINISRSLVDSGLFQALIQKRQPTIGDYITVFKYNFLISIILFLVINIFAKKIADIYQQPDVKNILHTLSFIVLIESFSVIQRALLIKHIKFNLITKINITSKVVAAIIAIILALKGYGIWSLVVKEMVTVIFVTTFFWLFNPIKINFSEKAENFKQLWGFGWKVFVADQIESFGNQIGNFVIGKNYTASELGFYQKAEQFQYVFSQTVVSSVNKVIFPTLAYVQDDTDKLKKGYKKIIILLMFLLFPVLISAILVAENFIPYLLGEKWASSIPYFQLLCIGGLVYPFTVINLNIIKVKGLANLYLKICILSKGLLIPAIFLGLLFGIKGLIMAIVVQRVVAAIINSYYSGKLVNYGLIEQILDIRIPGMIIFFIFIVFYAFKANITTLLRHELLIIIIIPILVFLIYLFLVFWADKKILHLVQTVTRISIIKK